MLPLEGPRPGLVWPVRVDPSGERGPTRGEVRSGRWRRTGAGLYVPREVEPILDQRIVEAAALIPAAGGGVTGWAALRWAGGTWFGGDGRHAITLATGSLDIRPPVGVRLSQERLGRGEVVTVDGLRMTNVARAVFFEMRYAGSVPAAVRVLDLACYSDLVTIDQMARFIEDRNGWTGIDVVRFALPLADENSWSPRETDTRMIWIILAELPAPRTNRPVFDLRGRHLATPDLLDEEAGLAVEYDSELHVPGKRRRRDRDRAILLRDHGLETMVVMAGDSPTAVARRMREERHRALARRGVVRAWTAVPPPWWVPTISVVQRRALDARQRVRYLAYRRAG